VGVDDFFSASKDPDRKTNQGEHTRHQKEHANEQQRHPKPAGAVWIEKNKDDGERSR